MYEASGDLCCFHVYSSSATWPYLALRESGNAQKHGANSVFGEKQIQCLVRISRSQNFLCIAVL